MIIMQIAKTYLIGAALLAAAACARNVTIRTNPDMLDAERRFTRIVETYKGNFGMRKKHRTGVDGWEELYFDSEHGFSCPLGNSKLQCRIMDKEAKRRDRQKIINGLTKAIVEYSVQKRR